MTMRKLIAIAPAATVALSLCMAPTGAGSSSVAGVRAGSIKNARSIETVTTMATTTTTTATTAPPSTTTTTTPTRRATTIKTPKRTSLTVLPQITQPTIPKTPAPAIRICDALEIDGARICG